LNSSLPAIRHGRILRITSAFNRENMTRYGFIGTGSMGSMLIRKFIGTGIIAPRNITASSKTGISARALAERTGITAAPSNTAVAKQAGILFLCVKPADVRKVLDEVWGVLQPGVLIVSIAGSVTLADLAYYAGLHARVARVIPAVTAEKGAGVSLVAFGRGATPEDRERILRLFNAVGTAVETEEVNFDLYADLTSCAPAFIAAMMREYAAAAVRTGAVEPAVAEFLLRKTLSGTARVLDDEGTGFDEVISRVATKGGITEEGVKVLEARLPGMFDEVLVATERKRLIRAKELARGE
jgi:pyrroline-5-carboxylate reductase